MSYRSLCIWVVLPVLGLLITAESSQAENATNTRNHATTATPVAPRRQEPLRPATATPSGRQNTTTSVIEVIDTLATTMSAVETLNVPVSVWREQHYPASQSTVVVPTTPRLDETDPDRSMFLRHGD